MQEALSAYGNPVDSSITMELFVKSSLVGRVIGKGGAKIREIMQLSGADVQVLIALVCHHCAHARTRFLHQKKQLMRLLLLLLEPSANARVLKA